MLEELAEAMLYLPPFSFTRYRIAEQYDPAVKASTEERSSTDLRQKTSFCRTWRPEDDGLNVYTRVQNMRSVWPHLIEQVHPCQTK